MATAGRHGIRGVLSTPLQAGEVVVGAFNIYSQATGFRPHDRRTTELISEQTAVLMARAFVVLRVEARTARRPPTS